MNTPIDINNFNKRTQNKSDKKDTYDIPLQNRELSEQEQQEENERLKKLQEISKEIQFYKNEILSLTWELNILIKYSSSEKIQHIQDNVKQECENCLEMQAEKKIKTLELQQLQNKLNVLQIDNKELLLAAYRDKLTGLKNRRAFEEDLENNIAKKEKFSLAIIDIDYFKKINDTYGHLIWDQVLKFISWRLKLLWCAYRWWGEEFLILYKWPEEELMKKINLIRQSISTNKLHLRNAQNSQEISTKYFYITFSTWVMNYIEDMNKKYFLDTVDSVMYYAKNKGWRNVVVWYNQVKELLPKPGKSNFSTPLELLDTSNDKIWIYK